MRAALLAAACLTAICGRGAEPKQLRLEPEEPGRVRIMSNLYHEFRTGSLSADERYLFTTGGDELAVWDVASGRIIKAFPTPGINNATGHTTNPDWVVLDLSSSISLTEREPNVIIDWKRGEIVGRQTDSEVPQRVVVRNQRKAREVAAGIRNLPSDYGMKPMKIWGVEISPSDSLLLTGGMTPLLYDLTNLRLHARLPYLDYLMATDPSLDYDTYTYMPKRKDHKGSKHNAFYNRFVFDTHFVDSATIRMGGATPVITTWNTDGQLLSTDRVPMDHDGPVFDVSSAGGYAMAGTLFGTFGRAPDGNWHRMDNLVQVPSKEGENKGWEALLGPGGKFLESSMTAGVSRPFGPKGKERVLVTLVHGSKPRHNLVELATGKVLCVSNSPGWGNLNDYDLLPDQSGALAVNGYNAAIWDWSRGDSIRIRSLKVDVADDQWLNSCLVLPDGNYIFGAGSGALIKTDANGKTLGRVVGSTGEVRGLALDGMGRRLYAMHTNNSVTIWDLPDLSLVATLYYFSPDGVMAVTPDHYYTMPPSLNEFVHFTRDNQVYSFSQFDMRNNRPDIVMERLGGNPESVGMLHKAWLKRLRRNGLTPEMLADDYNVPTVAFADADRLPERTSASTISFDVDLADAQEEIERLEVMINGVNVLTEDDLKLAPGATHRRRVTLDLAAGTNHIAVSARNRRGTSSLRAEHTVENESAAPARTLYAVCVGVSGYADRDFALNYAAKDAADIAAMLKEKCTEFQDVKTLLLTDGDFSAGALGRISDFIARAGRDDAVLLFYAGHGVVDGALDYYLAPADMDFNQPSARGVAIDDFTALAGAGKSLKRYVIIDACHSGRIDKEDFMAANVASVPTGDSGVVFRGAESLKFRSKEIEAVNSLISGHFADFNSASGAVVASSASGMEVAVESPEWQNGLFTYHLLRGLNSEQGAPAADSDSDGRTTMEEWLKYACEMVPRTTSGAQNPTLNQLESTSQPLVITTVR